MPRRQNQVLQERVVLAFDHAETTGDVTTKLWELPRAFRLERATYVNPTGLAADNDNWFDISVKNGATKMAAWSTDGNGLGINGDAAEGTIAADTFVELTMSDTDTDLVAAAGDVISFVLDETGTATLPAGRVVIEGRYI